MKTLIRLVQFILSEIAELCSLISLAIMAIGFYTILPILVFFALLAFIFAGNWSWLLGVLIYVLIACAVFLIFKAIPEFLNFILGILLNERGENKKIYKKYEQWYESVKMRKVIPGRYEIKLFEITYPTDLFGKNRFYNEFNAFLKNIKKGKKYSLLLEDRFYQEMQDIKVDQLSEEEKILELPASSLDEYYRQQIIAMSNGVNLTEYVGTDQEYLNRQIYVLYELLNKTDFNPKNVYSELDKEFLIEELKNNRKEVVENFEKSNVEFFIKETYENSGLNKFKDDSVYKFDKDILISDKLEDQAVLPELQRNVYLTGFPNEIIEELAKNQLKLKRTPLLLENSEYHGYTYNENNTVVFIGGEKPKYYYNDYKINVVKKPIEVLNLLKTSSNYYVSDFF